MAVYSLLPVRHIGNLDLRAESGEEEELRLAVAPDFFVTVQTTTRKLQVVTNRFPIFVTEALRFATLQF